MIRRAVLSSSVRSVLESLETRTLLSSGQLDPTFGSGGTLVLPLSINDTHPVVTTFSGKSTLVALDNRLFKITPSGSIDTTFAAAGQFALPPEDDGVITGLTVQDDGKVLIAVDPIAGNDALLLRLLPAGQLDSAFGIDGTLAFDFTSIGLASTTIISHPQQMLLQPDGNLLIAGIMQMSAGADTEIAISRLTPAGTADISFGTTGTTRIDSTDPTLDLVRRMRLAPDGKILLLDQATTADGYTTYIVNRLSANGGLDTGFGTGGFAFSPSTVAQDLIPDDIRLDAGGRVLVSVDQAQDNPVTHRSVILRYTSAGQADMSFNTVGFAAPPVTDSITGVGPLEVTLDGTIVAGDKDFFRLFGFSSEGVYDDTFLHPVSINVPANRISRIDDVIELADGRLLAIGAITRIGNNATPQNPLGDNPTAQIALARYIGDSQHDPIATLTGPATTPENQAAVFTGTGQAFGDRTITTYQWDVDYDGLNFSVTSTGDTLTVPAETWNGPSTHTIALRVIDSNGAVSAVTTLDVLVTNVPPVVLVNPVNPPAVENVPYTLALFASDVATDSVLLWTIDWGDGVVDTLPGNPSTATHTYAVNGPVTISVTATDTDGGVSSPATLDINVIATPQISGYIINDPDLDPPYVDGVEQGESGIANAQVYLDIDGNGQYDVGEPTTTSDAFGFYYFSGLDAGTYTVAVVRPDGLFYVYPTDGRQEVTVADASTTITASFGLADRYAATGVVYIDTNLSGTRDSGEPGLAGAVAFADLNGNGVLDADEPSAVTDANGAFSISPIFIAPVTIRVQPPTGWQLTSNVGGTSDNPSSFGAVGVAAIAGSVYDDRDADGQRQISDPGIGAATVYLDTNNNSILDPGEESVVTDPSGFYTFIDIPSGTYTVRLVVPDGYHLGTPAGGAYTDVSRVLNTPVSGLNFSLLRSNTITGLVYDDTNANGTRQGFEKPMVNIPVFLDYNNNGIADGGEPVVYTTPTGRYTFSNVPIIEGQRVRVELPARYRPTTPLGRPLPATAPGQNYVLNIGLTPQIEIFGSVFLDANKNRRYDAGDRALRGVYVYLDTNNNGRYDHGERYARTDALGRYGFTSLNPGTYVLRLYTPRGYHITTPAAGRYVMSLTAGRLVRNRNFGIAR